LIEEKIIVHFETTVNPQRIGYDIYKTFIRIENDRPKVAEFVSHLKAHPRMAWIALCEGSWDIILCMYAKTATEFHDMHVQLLSEFNPVILNFSSYTLIRTKMYKRGYFAARRSAHVVLGGDATPAEIDGIDLGILRAIGAHARLPATDIARKLKLTPAIVQSRIQRLERLEIISGYRIELNIAKLGMIFFKTQFFLRSYDLDLRKQFQEFCELNPYISCYTEQIGDCNVEIELHVPTHAIYSGVIDEIRARYSKFIKTFNTLLISESWYSWLPRDI